MVNKSITMLAAGDIILGDDPEIYFSSIGPVLDTADIRLGQLEVPYSNSAPELADLNRETDNLKPIAEYFDLVSLAGNHIYDAKETGVYETVNWLDNHSVPYFGGGRNISEARRPVIIDHGGVKVGFLSYNCTGPKIMTAGPEKAGCANLDIITHYELGDVANPGGPPSVVNTWPEPKSFKLMLSEISDLKKNCDVLCLYLHKGLVHKPVKLADYEQIVCYAAIDAGADVIFSSHPHILHGIEIYKGKTIYHSLGNFIAWVPSLMPDFKAKNGKKNEFFDPEEWARTRSERFGFVPDPEYPTYPFHPEAKLCITAKCTIKDGAIAETGYIPMVVNREGVPIVVKKDEWGEMVFDYMKKITEKAGLNAKFRWDGDEVVIGS